MTADQLEAAFRSKGEVRGGILFLRARDALTLIESAHKHHIRVLGIDAFRLSADATQSLMEHSIEFAKLKTEDTWAAATDFLRRYDGSELRLEVVLD